MILYRENKNSYRPFVRILLHGDITDYADGRWPMKIKCQDDKIRFVHHFIGYFLANIKCTSI